MATFEAPLTNEHVGCGLPLPSWFFPLTDDESMTDYVGKLTSKELVEWERQVAETEGLKGSRRAADLLQSRRGVAHPTLGRIVNT